MPFLYFIPTDANQVTREDIVQRGLGYAIDHTSGRGCTGPEHQRGFIFGKDSKTAVRMDQESQTWVPAPKLDAESPPYWVGFDSRPTPDELAREEQIAGDMITLMDGSQWKVPKLLVWQEGVSTAAVWSTSLPCCIDIDDNGNAADGAIIPKYSDLFDIGMKVFARMAGGGVGDLTTSQVITFAANCLGCNYRVSLLELSAKVMACLSTEDALKVIEIAIDWKGYEGARGNWAGRQGRPTTDTDSGSEPQTPEESTDTDPPLAN